MGIQHSFSRSKKKFKHLLPGRKQKLGRTGTETGGDRVGPAGSPPQSVSHVVAGGSHDLEDNQVSTDGRQGSTDQLLHQDESGLAPARGNETNQEGGEVDVDGGEDGRRHSHPDSDVEVAVGSRPSQEGNDADEVKVEQVRPSPSTPSIPHSGKPDGMLMWLFQLPPHLILPSDCVNTFAVPYHDVPEVLHLSAADDKSDWRSTVSATANLLRGVRDGPLKSIAGGLCTILENCEVWPSSHTSDARYLQSFQQTGVDIQAIELLAPRVKTLSGSLCAPIPQGDFNEKQRSRKLEW